MPPARIPRQIKKEIISEVRRIVGSSFVRPGAVYNALIREIEAGHVPPEKMEEIKREIARILREKEEGAYYGRIPHSQLRDSRRSGE